VFKKSPTALSTGTICILCAMYIDSDSELDLNAR